MQLVDGLLNTLKITAGALVIGVIIGVIIAAIRTSFDKNKESTPRIIYKYKDVDKIKNTYINLYEQMLLDAVSEALDYEADYLILEINESTLNKHG